MAFCLHLHAVARIHLCFCCDMTLKVELCNFLRIFFFFFLHFCCGTNMSRFASYFRMDVAHVFYVPICDTLVLFSFSIQAANYLNIKGLLDLACQTVADMIKGKTPEEIRKTFNIKNDFTPEEEEEIRRENQWAFE